MQLPVFDIITEACQDAWQNRRDVAAVAFLPVLGVSIVGTVMAAMIGDPRVVIDDPAQVSTLVVLRTFFGITVNWLFGIAFYSLFAVAWHRRTLVGPEAVTIGVAMRWGQRQWRFFRRLVLLAINLMALMFFLTILLMSFVPIALLLSGLLIAVGLVYARVSLVLPAAAIDTPMTFAQSAKLTAGNSWRMMLAVAVLPLVVMLIGSIAVLVVALLLGDIVTSSISVQLALSLLAQSVNYVGFALGITALSLAYRELAA